MNTHVRILLTACLAASCWCAANEPPKTPILRIDAGMHTGAIRRISTDDTGWLALTSSDDDTARLWDLRGSLSNDAITSFPRLLRTFRIPLDAANVTVLSVCALSPDGSLAAVGGMSGLVWQDANSVYVFETATGRLLHRMVGITGAIFDLSFSKRGNYLAAVTGNGEGLRIWRMTDGSEAGRDTEYGGRESYCVDWYKEERCVTSSFDGFVRLYRMSDKSPKGYFAKLFSKDGPRRLKPVEKVRVQGGREPNGVRFSPDGSKIAVGFHDATTVSVVDGNDLSFLFSPILPGPDWMRSISDLPFNAGGGLATVAWTQDGKTLAAAGMWERENTGQNAIRRWPQSGKGSPNDWDVSSDTINDLQALPGGGNEDSLLFAAFGPTWGILTGDGEVLRLGSPPFPDYRDDEDGGFRISGDGGRVAFSFKGNGETPAKFSVAGRVLQTLAKGVAVPSDLYSARIDGLEIDGWSGAGNATLAGEPLDIGQYECVHSLAIARSSSFFILGSDWHLRSFSAQGALQWSIAAPEAVFAANLTRDDRIAVVACGDGTVRWYHAKDGRELMGLFPHADQKRWVLWAPMYEELPLPMLGIGAKDPARKVEVATATGPAAAAGFAKGDVILSLDDAPVANFSVMTDLIRKRRIGDSVTVSFSRGRRKLSRKVILAKHPNSEFRFSGVYYDCSPGGDDLIGWHLNRGKDQAADFIPASRFRAIYYRPDVIQRVLKTRDVFEALRQANAEAGLAQSLPETIMNVVDRLAPPVVEVETGGIFREVTLPPEADSVSVAYRVRRTNAEKVKEVAVWANGRPLVRNAPIPEGNSAGTVKVPLPAGFEGELAVFASHALARSEGTTLRVRRNPPRAPPRKPNLFVLSIGVAKLAMNDTALLAAHGQGSGSKDRFLDLEFAARDAQSVATALASQQGKAFAVVEAQVLLDKEATTRSLRRAITEIGAKVESGDVVFVFFSGHGNHDPKTGKFHLVTHDTDPVREGETALSGEELSRLLGDVRGNVVVALDACHSGAVLGMQRGAKYKAPPLDISGLANQLSSAEHGIVVFSSSQPDEVSFEDPELRGGLFTKALLDGLAGEAAKDGVITCRSLMQWVDQRVPELVGAGETDSQASKVVQTPITVMPAGVPDFVLGKP